MTQYGFYFDSTRCTGCRTCEMACKDIKDLPASIAFRTVYDYEGGTFTVAEDGTCSTDAYAYHVSVSCNQCNEPACLAICPQEAISKDAETGIVTSDPAKCIGCGSCTTACPYGAPKVNEDLGKSVKCDACSARVAEGKNPICVDACPLRALEFGDIEELRAAHADGVAAIAPLPAADMTDPNLVILACPAAKEPDDETGFVANELEVEGSVD
ncbi:MULTISPECIES: 4Fe-4S dicluster domain-containing protein [unclassified Adlercreutzia]|uniref:4Fe-4S dicluster domain-containing protein n=1 Tax=unclassified Adlercreutzia TaxID=2636013 RepID=UPI0013ED52F5|nr:MULTISPECIES: 4Fe-4S dicluster domain-containing protein [unclassified Adlercreutzia]